MLKLELLGQALHDARQCLTGEAPAARANAKHRARSSRWVDCLAERLRALAASPNVVVFSKSDKSNRKAFGLNEMLFDICVCETDECDAYRGNKKLTYITRALWLVESEFARNSAEAVKDFNKLVIGRADNKLFIAPRLETTDRERKYLDVLLPVARRAARHGRERVRGARPTPR